MSFWEGIVEDRDDPESIGRVRVRIFGIHSTTIPTNLLPWSYLAFPTTSACNSGIGNSQVGLPPGTKVLGYFRDDEGQYPVVIATLPNIHLAPEREILDPFSSNLSKNTFSPKQEDLKTTPVELANSQINPGDQPLLINALKEPFPRESFTNRTSNSEITTNDSDVPNPSIERKIKPVEEGGNLDLGIKIGFFECESYEVIPQRSTNSNKANFASYSNKFRFSTNIPSTFDKFPPAINGSKDSNNDCVYTNKIKNYSDQNIISQLQQNIKNFMDSITKSKEQLWEENPGLRTYKDI